MDLEPGLTADVLMAGGQVNREKGAPVETHAVEPDAA